MLRQRERVQRQKQDASISEAYQKSGLQLNDEQRALFHKRYLQERRRLEEQRARHAGETANRERGHHRDAEERVLQPEITGQRFGSLSGDLFQRAITVGPGKRTALNYAARRRVGW